MSSRDIVKVTSHRIDLWHERRALPFRFGTEDGVCMDQSRTNLDRAWRRPRANRRQCPALRIEGRLRRHQ
jgi:hypothetical protein